MTAALGAAVFLCVWLMLPPAARTGPPSLERPTRVRGAFHVHTTESDGGGTRDDVARAAAAAALQFVIVTDHGDGTRVPHAPEYLHGVLMLDGVEVTTSAGHYAAFGLSQSPYPLGGPAYAVVEDVERLGGFGVAAHPNSPKADLRWRDWSAPIGGLEVINGDSAWRDEGAMTLARGLIGYLFRPAEVLAGMVERPAPLLRRLDRANRRLVALAGADAHARLPITSDDEPAQGGWTVPAPSYETSFRAFANVVDVAHAFSGDAARDAAALTQAIRAARVSIAMTALVSPSDLDFSATPAGGGSVGIYHMGSAVPAQPLVFRAQAWEAGPSGRSDVRLTLLRNGEVAATSETHTLTHRAEGDVEGTWRVEATLAQRPDVPWLLSNPIKVLSLATAAGGRPFPRFPEEVMELTSGGWAVEKQAASHAAVAEREGSVVFDYALAGGEASGQFGAAAREVGGTSAWSHVVLRARATEPTRLWVQLRLNDSASGQRWGRSIYVDRHSREFTLGLAEFAPLEPGDATRRPSQATVRAVLLVVDTVNSPPGRRGQVTIERLALERHPIDAQ